jgi:hypothetical protein
VLPARSRRGGARPAISFIRSLMSAIAATAVLKTIA